MKLYAREFYRGLRRSVRREVKARPEWRKAARLARRGSRPGGGAALRWVVPLLLLIPALIEESRPLLWGIVGLWALIMACFRAGQLQSLGAGQEGVTAFLQVPVSDAEVFRFIRGRILRRSCWFLVDSLVVLSVACVIADVRPVAWLGVVPAALLLWASVLALAVGAFKIRPQMNYAGVGTALFYCIFVGGQVLRATKTLTPERLETTAVFLSWATPPGWATQIAAWVAGGGGGPFPFAALGLLVLAIGYAVPCCRALAEQFVFWEPERLPFARAEESDEVEPEPPRESRASEVEERIGTRAFLTPLADGARGWIERLVFRGLRRHATVLDFLVGTMPGWSGLFRFGVLSLLAVPLLAWLVAQVSGTAGAWMLGGGLLTTLFCTTPLFGGRWSGFDLGQMGHRFIAVLSLLPVGFREIRRVVLAVNAVRFALALPCWLAAGWIVSRAASEAPLTGVRWAAELWLVALLLQPFFLVFAFSRGTNDTASGCLPLAVIFLGGLMTLATCGAAIAVIFVNGAWPWQAAAFLALAASSFGFERAYRWLYCSQRFDLLAKSHGTQ